MEGWGPIEARLVLVDQEAVCNWAGTSVKACTRGRQVRREGSGGYSKPLCTSVVVVVKGER